VFNVTSMEGNTDIKGRLLKFSSRQNRRQDSQLAESNWRILEAPRMSRQLVIVLLVNTNTLTQNEIAFL